jgi:DNA-nicking Smr family endonuclease
MAKKKKQHQDVPVKQPEFHTTPFKALKEVALKVAPPEKEPKKDSPPAPQPPVQKPDESILFLEAMQGVKKLAAEQAPVKAPPSGSKQKPTVVPEKQQGTTINIVDTEFFNQLISQLKLDVTFADKFPEDEELKPLAVNRLRQLKKGVINVDRQMDLHGLTKDEALAAMPRFLQNARAHGEKAVLIITGKGNNSPGEPVLQQAITAWLRLQGKEHVLEFAPAPREMGGSGAFVVFLRMMEEGKVKS